MEDWPPRLYPAHRTPLLQARRLGARSRQIIIRLPPTIPAILRSAYFAPDRYGGLTRKANRMGQLRVATGSGSAQFTSSALQNGETIGSVTLSPSQ